MNIITISKQILFAVKTNGPAGLFINMLENISEETIREKLCSDDLKKAFWINLYNAFTQVILSKNPSRYTSRSSFFRSRKIIIAGIKLSLDDIEHGILRRSKIKWSEGYLNKPFPSKFEKENRVSRVDYRIHFALNCGAKSCPPIIFYDPEKLDQQLDIATISYLKEEAEYDSINNIVALPAIMGWFSRDFGGKQKMEALLKKLEIIPGDINPKITFKKYNWNLFPANYKTNNHE